MQHIKWGIIGCGAVTEVKSGPAFYKVPHSQLVAVMRRDRVRAQDYAQRHRVEKFYSDVDQLIRDSQVDAVYVATPPSSHHSLALKVAAAGKPCCVEKPMALNYEACCEMADAFERKNLPLFVAYYRRSLPRFNQIKAWLDEGQIGQVRQLHWSFSKPPNRYDLEQQPNWRTQPDISGGGYFFDLACHGINLFQYLLGDIEHACGIATNQQGLYQAEDAVSACWQFANGALGSAYWNFAAHDRTDHVEIIGSAGKISFSVFVEAPLVLTQIDAEEKLHIPNPEHIQYHHVENMVAHLRGEKTHPSLASSAVRTNWVMAQILSKSGHIFSDK